MDDLTSHLFTPYRLRDLELPNRIAVSPMCQYSAVDGVVQPWHAMHVGALARSNPGVVIMEATAVAPEGRISPACTGLWNDAQEAAMAQMIAEIRSYAATPLGIQLGHAGRKASTRTPWEAKSWGEPLPVEDGGWPTVGPTGAAYDRDWSQPTALDEAGLERVKGEWVEATVRADRCGFDLIEIHAAHGYLLSSFFSPVSNRRTDRYGGDIAGRMAFPLEVASAMRQALSPSKPLGIRINGADWLEDGSTVDDAVTFAAALKAVGVDYVVTSAGSVAPGVTLPPLVPGYMTGFAERVKAETGVCTMAVGLIVDPLFAEEVLRDGRADLVALGRAFLDDPNWPIHAAQALGEEPVYARSMQRARPRNWPGHAYRRVGVGID